MPASALPANDLPALLRELLSLKQRRDMSRRAQLCRATLKLLDQKSRPKMWAALQVKLANSLVQNPLGNRIADLKQAIHHCRQALDVYTREAFLTNWAMIQNNLERPHRWRIGDQHGAGLPPLSAGLGGLKQGGLPG